MIIDLAREQFRDIPDNENVALSHFGFGGVVTAKQIRDAISEKPGNDHVQLWGDADDPRIRVCTKGELGKFFSGGSV